LVLYYLQYYVPFPCAETPSDASDYEARIKFLNEELKRRKLEAEGLKKEQKKRRKDRMKEKEAELNQQIAVGPPSAAMLVSCITLVLL
jgi:hypothetical protein